MNLHVLLIGHGHYHQATTGCQFVAVANPLGSYYNIILKIHCCIRLPYWLRLTLSTFGYSSQNIGLRHLWPQYQLPPAKILYWTITRSTWVWPLSESSCAQQFGHIPILDVKRIRYAHIEELNWDMCMSQLILTNFPCE